jgi:hypothetical protein
VTLEGMDLPAEGSRKETVWLLSSPSDPDFFCIQTNPRIAIIAITIKTMKGASIVFTHSFCELNDLSSF